MAGRPRKQERLRAKERQRQAAPTPFPDGHPTRPEDVPPKRSRRVRFCAWMMVTGRWFGLETHIELSKAWHVSVVAIRLYSMEAGHLLEVPPEELVALRQASKGFFSSIARRASEERSSVTGLPDWRNAIEARRLADKYGGYDADQVSSAAATVAPPRIEIVVFGDATAVPAAPKT